MSNLRPEQSAAVPEVEWIRVADQLPELGQLVLGWYDGTLAVFARDASGGEGWLWSIQTAARDLVAPWGLECDDDYAITHWMPLPAPPESKP